MVVVLPWQVVVRVRPPSRAEEEDEGAGKEVCVRKTGPGSVEIHGQGFTFDSVADEASTQVGGGYTILVPILVCSDLHVCSCVLPAFVLI